MNRRRKLLIIGNGMAATRLLDELLRQDRTGFDITVIGEEPAAGYNRILLSSWLAGEKQRSQLITHNDQWYRDNHIQLHSGDPVVSLDSDSQIAVTLAGEHFHWDQLVLATGSRATRLPVPGADLDNVITFRTLADADRILEHRGERAVVIGGGLLGLEAAHGLQQRGFHVSLVQNSDWLMNRQLDREAGELLARTLEQRGVTVLTGARTASFIGHGQRVSGVALEDGRTLPCSLAVMAVGITPEISLARDIGIECDRAIAVDALLQSNIEGISALGECCEIHGECFGLVAPIQQQARVLAARLAGRESAGYQREVLPTRLKVSGIDVFSAGNLDALENCRSLVWRDTTAGHYRRLWLRNDRLVAAVLFGNVASGNHYFDLIQAQQGIARPGELLLDTEAA